MAKASLKRQGRVDLENLSQKDIDILVLLPRNVMKKYKLEKQPVYDRRFALNKKIKAAGLTVEQVLNKTDQGVAPVKKAQPKKARASRAEVEKEVAKTEEQ